MIWIFRVIFIKLLDLKPKISIYVFKTLALLNLILRVKKISNYSNWHARKEHTSKKVNSSEKKRYHHYGQNHSIVTKEKA